jgi:GDP-4-dehydro-6-deoxy-D-mannose reductase
LILSRAGHGVRVLITGIAGFAGSHLAEYALSHGAEVFGVVRPSTRTDRIEAIKSHLALLTCDLRSDAAVQRLIDAARPDYVFHLAAENAKWGASPAAMVSANVTGQLNVLEAMRTRRPDAAIHIAGSYDEYGLVFEEECPISENNPIRPLSAYAVSKVAQDLLGYQYFMSYGLRIVRTRAFQHIGARQPDSVIVTSLARQVVEIERGLRPPLLSIRRPQSRHEFLDVRDIVRAYWLTIQKATPGEVYNVAAGQAYSTRQLLERLLAAASLTGEVRIVQRGDRTRPSEMPLLVGNSRRLMAATGWVPLIGLEQTCAELLDYWRDRLPERVP